MAGTLQATGNAPTYNNFRVLINQPFPLPNNFDAAVVDVKLTKYTILCNNLTAMLTAATTLHGNAAYTPSFVGGTVTLARRLTWVTTYFLNGITNYMEWSAEIPNSAARRNPAAWGTFIDALTALFTALVVVPDQWSVDSQANLGDDGAVQYPIPAEPPLELVAQIYLDVYDRARVGPTYPNGLNTTALVQQCLSVELATNNHFDLNQNQRNRTGFSFCIFVSQSTPAAANRNLVAGSTVLCSTQLGLPIFPAAFDPIRRARFVAGGANYDTELQTRFLDTSQNVVAPNLATRPAARFRAHGWTPASSGQQTLQDFVTQVTNDLVLQSQPAAWRAFTFVNQDARSHFAPIILNGQNAWFEPTPRCMKCRVTQGYVNIQENLAGAVSLMTRAKLSVRGFIIDQVQERTRSIETISESYKAALDLCKVSNRFLSDENPKRSALRILARNVAHQGKEVSEAFLNACERYVDDEPDLSAFMALADRKALFDEIKSRNHALIALYHSKDGCFGATRGGCYGMFTEKGAIGDEIFMIDGGPETFLVRHQPATDTYIWSGQSYVYNFEDQIEKNAAIDILTTIRCFADLKKDDTNTKPSIHDSDTVVLPGTSSRTASQAQPPPPGSVPLTASSPATPSSNSTIPPESIPKTPPTPPGGKLQTAPPTSVPPPPSNTSAPSAPIPPSPPPPPPRQPRRFRRFIVYLVLIGALSYAGGVYYSLLSDNFHDFFTEYVPFGEEAVLYFEEREYRKRFPNITNPTNRPTLDAGNKVTIPSKSGVSWRVADDTQKASDSGTKGRHTNAVDSQEAQVNKSNTANAQQTPSQATSAEKTKAVEGAKKTSESQSSPLQSAAAKAKEAVKAASPAPSSKPAETTTPSTSTAPVKQPETANIASTRPPEVNEPSRIMPVEPIDPLKVKNANEPLVQDLVNILNDIITVVNNDGSSFIYNSTMSKAKTALVNVCGRIVNLKQTEQQKAEEEIKSMHLKFDEGAKDLVKRIEQEQQVQIGQWRDEFESERDKLSQNYQERLSVEMKRAQEVMEQRVGNELLQQALTLKKQFLSDVTSQVENERNGRLAKLSDLSSSVSELEKLTGEWNGVVDANLRTQHLQVAVEAVRSTLERADRPRPFVHELAALKEIAADDSVINAAIASINPTAYQKGMPTSAQLIDRFRRVAAEVRKAALLPNEAGVASHAASWALSKVLFKKKGMTVGDDVESVLTRTETLLEEGNLDEAAREMTGLQGWAKTLSWDWLSEARRVLEVRQAMDVIATEARLEGLKVES
ncbi:uncharacterized protein KY384_001826 [Bacidia gigantensis]|uniref:uncharacterized protein n=1 Tax=Bacidia gigantensis TaxID=2732470 RepID=UPI001D053D28|nr:uncharacterized protein KY384_001826 [Bacidia gigantensis]KAG8533043.1 hypothetical protein KY384_001826 [Bacidia gigantensis]